MEFLLYGATGYTGSLIARRAIELGMRPTLGGRSPVQLSRLAHELALPFRVGSANDSAALDAMIDAHPVVLNCAGPFSRTADAVVASCLRRRAHYLDITGEMAVFESMAARDADAKHAGIMLLPGVGFDVVPSDCLAAHVARRLPSATRLQIAIRTSGGISRGTALTAIEGFAAGKGAGAVRKGGRITRVPPAWKTRQVDFGRGAVPATTMPWGDVSTAYHSTGIPDIEVYMTIPTTLRHLMEHGRFLLPLAASGPVRRWLERRVRHGAPGPDAAHRARGRSRFWAEAADDAGRRARARLIGPESYDLTVRTALECVARVLRGDVQPGFQTPSRAYGPDLILGIEGVEREDIPG